MSPNDFAGVRLLVSSLAMLAALSCAPFGPDETSEEAEKNDQAIIGGKPALGYPEAALVNMLYGNQVSSICSGPASLSAHCPMGLKKPTRMPRLSRARTRPSATLVSPTASPLGIK